MNDKIFALFFFVLFLFGMIACSPNRKNAGKIENMALSLDTTFSELSDSSFVPTRIMDSAHILLI
ncbi:MAG: hypothetical protein LBG15_02550 [Dysgonamonadaceae bacterium]|jgi:hypothetical protein|nr:hypothetical protein [Dysgonamonadaceae bacterium]